MFAGRRRDLRRVALFLSSLLVVACATTRPPALDRALAGRTIEGRLSVRYKDLETAKEESLSGRFVWTATVDDVELSLLDPLGQTVALVRSGPAGASIMFRDGRRVDGASPEALTRNALGWTLPMHGLRDWLDGRPDRDASAATLPDGRLVQDRWTIRFVVPDGAAGDAPPRRIDLSYPGPPVEVEMRLVVDSRSPP